MRGFSGLVLDAQQKDRAMAALNVEAAKLRDKVYTRNQQPVRVLLPEFQS